MNGRSAFSRSRAGRSTIATAVLFAVAGLLSDPGRLRAADTSDPLSRETRREIVDAINHRMIDGYVFEDSARIYAGKLEESFVSGRYDSISERGALARALTEDLQRFSRDRHLRILADSGGVDSSRGPQRRRPGGRVPVNEGFGRVEILTGNVGYLDLRGFHGSTSGRSKADSAMKALAGVKALVIDLGHNGGGDGRMVQYLSSYFFERPTHLVDRVIRGQGPPMEEWTLEQVPGPRLARTPLYLLTSKYTFSAAEAFAFGLQINDRVTIVGEPTGGGGHFGRVEPLVAGLAIWLPHGKPYDPRTGQGWQETAVLPDVAVAYEQALDKALELARAAR